MHSLELVKPDGRALTLYARAPIAAGRRAPSPFTEPLRAQPAPALASAARRMGRPMPRTARTAPSCRRRSTTRSRRPRIRAQSDRAAGRRLGRRRVRQPLPVARRPRRRTTRRRCIVPTAPADGQCEVVVFTQDRDVSLGALPLRSHRAAAAGVGRPHAAPRRARRRSSTCCPFENRGAEVGVTLHHPHGQIYAYPVVPPVPARMQRRRASTTRARPRPAGDA